MNILVLNSGSSSIKFSVFASKGGAQDTTDPGLLLDGEVSGLGTANAALSVSKGGASGTPAPLGHAPDAAAAIGPVLQAVAGAGLGTLDAVGYRVVHPGPDIHEHIRITDEVLGKLEAAARFAPLHDPDAVALIRETMRQMPAVPHFACFDTIFHQTMPDEASTYAIPREYRDRGVKRYGFHGLSCESVVRQIARQIARQAARQIARQVIRQVAGTPPLPARIVIAHLGSGCSVTALAWGKSVDTTMGLTPTGGVVMGTRPGDLDPGLLLYLLREPTGPKAIDEIEAMLNHRAGMVALTGLPNDMRAVREAAASGGEGSGREAAALLALKVFTRSVRKAIGGYAWLLGGLDMLVFTGGIGEHDAATRAEILDGVAGVSVNSALNMVKSEDLRQISASHSETAIFVAPAQEDLVIALHVERMVHSETNRTTT